MANNSNNNYVPATRRTSNIGSRPNNDPLNLVKISTNPLALQAQETLQILEVQKTYKSQAQKDGNDAWINELDNWKNKRKSIQPSSIRSLDMTLSTSEEPSTFATSRTSLKGLLRHNNDDDDNDDDDDDDGAAEDKTTIKPLESEKPLEDVSVSKEDVFDQKKSIAKEDRQEFKEATGADDSLKTYPEVKRTEVSVSNITSSITKFSTPQTFKSTRTSLDGSGLCSTPKEAARRPNVANQAIERPKSSFIAGNVPKVPFKKTAKNFSSIPESEAIEVSKKKYPRDEEKTAQASIKKFNNIKNFFEQASQNVEVDVKAPKPVARRGVSSAVDSKKRMSLGPGVLERSSRSSVAIANDKEFIIDELYVDSSKSPVAKFQAKPASQLFQMKERESAKPVATAARSPTKVYSFSTDEENAPPAKAEISIEDFKGMISLPTSPPSAIKAQSANQPIQEISSVESKTEDEVFMSPVRKGDKNTSPKFSDFREINKASIKIDGAGDENISVGQGFKVASTEKQLKEPVSILKQSVQKENAKKMFFHENETQSRRPLMTSWNDSPSISEPLAQSHVDKNRSKDECKHPMDGNTSMETVSIEAYRGRSLSKHEENLNSSVSVGTEEIEEPTVIWNEVPKSIEVVTKQSEQESKSIGKQMTEKESHITAADYSNLNSFSAKIDKLLEELKFIPASLTEPASNLQQIEDGKPAEINDSELEKCFETFDAVDGKSCNDATSRIRFGQILEKTFSQGKAMPSVTTSKVLRSSEVDGEKRKMKDSNFSKATTFPTVPPKPTRTNSCKNSFFSPGLLTSSDGRFSKKDEKIETGLDLSAKVTPNLLDVSAGRAKVELSRRAKRRPPSIKGRSLSLEDLDSASTKNLVVVDVVEDKNGFCHHSSEVQGEKLRQREEESSIDDDDEDDDDKPPSLPSCPPPIMSSYDETQLMFTTTEPIGTTTLSLQETGNADSDEDLLPESSA